MVFFKLEEEKLSMGQYLSFKVTFNFIIFLKNFILKCIYLYLLQTHTYKKKTLKKVQKYM